MKLHEFTQAPNPRRVRIFLAEKGIQVPLVQVNIAAGENRQPAFLAKNPMGTVPVSILLFNTKDKVLRVVHSSSTITNNGQHGIRYRE